MLVKNTIIALMAVAPAFTIPIPGPDKSTSTVATTKSTTPITAKVSKAAVTKANNAVKGDLGEDKRLRQELREIDSKLAVDWNAAKQLQTGDAKTRNAKPTDSDWMHTIKFASKIPQFANKLPQFSTGRNRLSNHHITGSRNINSLRIGTTASPGTRQSVTPPGSALASPRSGRSSLPSAVGTGQSAFTGGVTGFQSPGFQSPGFLPFVKGMGEEVTFTPNTGGGYTERISMSPQRQQISRRAVTPTTPLTPTTPTTPLTPIEAYIQKQKSRKSSTTHQHTVAEAMQLSALLVEAEKVVNGLQEQMNKPQTVFTDLKFKRKSKFTRPSTHATPATPATPSPDRTT